MIRPLAIALSFAATSAAFAQRGPDFRWERALAAGSEVALHTISGDIAVKASTNGRVEVLGYKTQGDASRVHVEVRETSRGIIVCVVDDDTDWSCDENGYHTRSNDRRDSRDGWNRATIDLAVAVPARMNVRANSVSGDLSLQGVQGDVSANTVSGDVTMEQIRGATVTGHSVSGDITAQIDALTGQGPLSFKTVSGDVTLELPRMLDADLSMTTVSGRLDSDYRMTLNGQMNRRSVDARIGNGGRNLDVTTVSGNVRLRAVK